MINTYDFTLKEVQRLSVYREAVRQGFYNEGLHNYTDVGTLPASKAHGYPAWELPRTERGAPHYHDWNGRWIECDQQHYNPGFAWTDPIRP